MPDAHAEGLPRMQEKWMQRRCPTGVLTWAQLATGVVAVAAGTAKIAWICGA
jgi:hypothetical protein